MERSEIKQEIIQRMSMISNTFKVLAGTALIGLTVSENAWIIAILFGVMDIYYFYIEKYVRNTDEFKAVFFKRGCCVHWKSVFKSFSVWGYYLIMVIITILYLKVK